MQRFRYYLVIASVMLTLWMATRAKALVGESDHGYHAAPPRLHGSPELSDFVSQTPEDEHDQELSGIQW